MQEFLKNKTRKAQRTNQTSFFKEVLENSPVPLGKDCTWTELKNMENIWVWWQPEQGSHCTEDELALLAPRSTRAVALHRWICESCKGEWSDVSSWSRGPAEQREEIWVLGVNKGWGTPAGPQGMEEETQIPTPAKPLNPWEQRWLAEPAWAGKGTTYKPFHLDIFSPLLFFMTQSLWVFCLKD